MKYYFLLFLLYSEIYAEEDTNYDECHTKTPANSVVECLSRQTEVLKSMGEKCCFFEGKKDDGSNYKECKMLEYWDKIEDLIVREKENYQNNVVSYICDAKDASSESQSRSDSNYLHLRLFLLSLLILI
jgi:hypothetical protein